MGTHVNLYNSFLVYCRELAPGTVSLTGDRAQGDDSKHDSHYTFCWTRAQILLLDFDINNTLLRTCILRPCYKSKKECRDQESIQSPHLTQDTNAKVTTSQLDITNDGRGGGGGGSTRFHSAPTSPLVQMLIMTHRCLVCIKNP